MSYEKKDYRAVECSICCGGAGQDWNVEVLELVNEKETWTPILFHVDKEEARGQVERLKQELNHKKTCQFRIGWKWDSRVPVQTQREIDRWYNSLSEKNRKMIDLIISDFSD